MTLREQFEHLPEPAKTQIIEQLFAAMERRGQINIRGGEAGHTTATHRIVCEIAEIFIKHGVPIPQSV